MLLNWKVIPFDQLSLEQLYDLMRLRQEVFVVEQNCPYLDNDGKDLKSLHLLGCENDELLAYARLVPPQISYNEPSIGRIVSDPKHRGRGLGKELLTVAKLELKRHFGNLPIRISGQCYLQKFYEDFDFVVQGKEYLEDDIPHIEMLYTP